MTAQQDDESVVIMVVVAGTGSSVSSSSDSSSSSSSDSSSSSSAASSAGGGSSAPSGGGGESSASAPDSGGRRHSIEQSESRIFTLLRNRAARLRERLRRQERQAPAPSVPGWCDVPSDRWFAEDIRAFTDRGYLPNPDCRFRPLEGATRGDMAELLVTIGGYRYLEPPSPSFDDVPRAHPRYRVAEEAGARGVMIGYGDCYGTHPCFDRLDQRITRAEAAAMIVRYFSLTRRGDAPRFPDVRDGTWYVRTMQVAADHCVVRGDARTGLGRPEDTLSRAEMVAMIRRATMGLRYGTDCSMRSAAPESGDMGDGGAAAFPDEPARLLPAPEGLRADPALCDEFSADCLWHSAASDAGEMAAGLTAMLLASGAGLFVATPRSQLTAWIVAAFLLLVICTRLRMKGAGER